MIATVLGIEPSQIVGGGFLGALLVFVGRVLFKDQTGQERLAAQYETRWHDCEAELQKAEQKLDTVKSDFEERSAAAASIRRQHERRIDRMEVALERAGIDLPPTTGDHP